MDVEYSPGAVTTSITENAMKAGAISGKSSPYIHDLGRLLHSSSNRTRRRDHASPRRKEPIRHSRILRQCRSSYRDRRRRSLSLQSRFGWCQRSEHRCRQRLEGDGRGDERGLQFGTSCSDLTGRRDTGWH
jgi:hypothetical protein